MYLKRTSKLLDLSVSRTNADVNLRDLMCPVCRGILIEPVTLPCTHNLCLRCLKGTFEHNSLSCPLCRVRVGSWLRNATKTETLVNHGLWQLIRAKFPKEVENKHNGEERDVSLDADYAANRILSAAGEIHREYEMQLQMAEEEMRRRRQVEQMASEALIQKIRAEEQQLLLAQLAQDQLLAKTLAKQQVAEKQKEAVKCYNECIGTSVSSYVFNASGFKTKILPENNIQLSQSESTPTKGSLEMRLSESLDDNSKAKQMNPGCSTSRTYTMETKEELRVPSDVVNSKKKSLGVEVCMMLADDDKRIGSAESSGSHDSINQEIHHFKPIKTVPRTKLKLSSDGKQIDPKLIRVIPILKKVSNIVPKPPSPTNVKRIGCSWSAFKGRIKRDAKEKQAAALNVESTKTISDQKPSTSLGHPQILSNKPIKCQNDVIRRLDFVPEPSFDSNKNYTKNNTNNIINGTKVSKKLSLDDESDTRKTRKSWRTHVRNGMVTKSKGRKNLWRKDRKGTEFSNVADEQDELMGSDSSFEKTSSQDDKQDIDNNDRCVAVEGIAEQIKKKKENTLKERKTLKLIEMKSIVLKRTTIKRTLSERRNSSPTTDRISLSLSQDSGKFDDNCAASRRTKRPRASKVPTDASSKIIVSGLRKSVRNSTKVPSRTDHHESDDAGNKFNYDSPPESCDETECISKSAVSKFELSDEEVIEEQQRIERLLLQEREDFELARRLQAQFDEMERIAGRTRRSRQVTMSARSAQVDSRDFNVARTVCRPSGARKTTQRNSTVNGTANTLAKRKRGRPPKRMKITLDARENETRTR
ncbi:E3 ubiquitin-protein ligase RNF169 isoform X2 [Ooceraea biroi]|uniref:E3 ubiquitin-protein ligase RNF169 isoform X2 n=1 Tax=Ooceraea biroi TaxID=2015173 RepID=UPI0005BE09A6|nr:E3 ubiquitin-protein ligase RNF169 isoform X2 [Ooceraea biroi]